MLVGTVAEIWRYPVKSMAGERVATSAITAAGVDGDRRSALRDVETGKIISAKRPARWGQLLDYAATVEGSGVEVTTPHGERIKLMRPPTPPTSAAAPDYLTSRSGLSFFTLYCSDLTDTLAKAEASGATLRSDRGHIEEGRALRLCFVNDPEGNVFELVERN